METKVRIALDTSVTSAEVSRLERDLKERVVGQDRAISRIVHAYQMFESKLVDRSRPIANFLLLGPTGTGKTRLVEAISEVLFGFNRILKINCGEFQHSHEIAKLIGAPPGYIGHNDNTTTIISQEKLEEHWGEGKPQISLMLFDEIEKAHFAVSQLLLAILDKAELTLGNSKKVFFNNSIIFMTSNLGSKSMLSLLEGGIGFRKDKIEEEELDQRLYQVAADEARRHFSPEFMNRIDKIVVFRSLTRENLENIFEIELGKIRERIFIATTDDEKFFLQVSPEAKKFVIDEGTDSKFGARHLKRAMERFILFPLSALMASKQIKYGALVVADIESKEKKLKFFIEESRMTRLATV